MNLLVSLLYFDTVFINTLNCPICSFDIRPRKYLTRSELWMPSGGMRPSASSDVISSGGTVVAAAAVGSQQDRVKESKNMRHLRGLAAFGAAAAAPFAFSALTSGLTARLPFGDRLGLADILSLSFCFLRFPSLISPPDISLPEPASARGRLLFTCSDVAGPVGRCGADEGGA